MEYFTRIDFLSQQPSLLINSKVRFKNAYGAIFSIFLVVIMGIIAIFLLKDKFNKNQIESVSSKDYNYDPYYDLRRIPIIIDILDSNKITKNSTEKVFQISAIMIHNDYQESYQKVNIRTNSSELELKKCKDLENNFIFDMNQFPEFKSKENAFCINSTVASLALKGHLGDYMGDVAYLSIKISKCVNSTNNNFSCFPEERIETEISKAQVEIIIPDYYFYNLNSDTLHKPYLKSHSVNLNYHLLKQTKFYFQNVAYEVDNGLCFGNKILNNFTSQKKIEKDFSIKSPHQSEIYEALFTMSKTKQVFYIRYGNLINYLSQIFTVLVILWYGLYWLNGLIFSNLYYLHICQYNKIIDKNNDIYSYNLNNKYSLRLLKTKKAKINNFSSIKINKNNFKNYNDSTPNQIHLVKNSSPSAYNNNYNKENYFKNFSSKDKTENEYEEETKKNNNTKNLISQKGCCYNTNQNVRVASNIVHVKSMMKEAYNINDNYNHNNNANPYGFYSQNFNSLNLNLPDEKYKKNYVIRFNAYEVIKNLPKKNYLEEVKDSYQNINDMSCNNLITNFNNCNNNNQLININGLNNHTNVTNNIINNNNNFQNNFVNYKTTKVKKYTNTNNRISQSENLSNLINFPKKSKKSTFNNRNNYTNVIENVINNPPNNAIRNQNSEVNQNINFINNKENNNFLNFHNPNINNSNVNLIPLNVSIHNNKINRNNTVSNYTNTLNINLKLNDGDENKKNDLEKSDYNSNHHQDNFNKNNYCSSAGKVSDLGQKTSGSKPNWNTSTQKYLKDYVDSFFKSGGNSKKRIIEKLINYVNKKLSIEEVLRKIIEFDKIKFVLLENEILGHLRNIPCRLICDNENENKLKLNDFPGKNIVKSFYQDAAMFEKISDDFKEIKNFWIMNEFDDDTYSKRMSFSKCQV